ncbi:MAG TPA: CoA pyrophosphatase [Polyangiaceae bacterium]|nr:CoA pyrophosphatase [Polyangiaceae bacterium]
MATAYDLATVKERIGSWAGDPRIHGEARAAVATLLREGTEGVEALLIKRAERLGDPWSGHVAFPGGKREPGESLLLTAIRETREEVGIRVEDAALVTRLKDVEARTNGILVAHFVFGLDDAAAGSPSLATSAEVDSTLWVSLSALARREGAGTFVYRTGAGSIELPCFHVGPHVLWGMTYRMTMNLLEALDRPT